MTMQHAAITKIPAIRAIGVHCGLKESGNSDLALILADQPCRATAVFTRNQFKAAPLLYDQALLTRTQTLQAVIINAGNANGLTGQQGIKDAAKMAQLTESACNLPPDSAFVMSTGVLGHHLPMDKIKVGIQQAHEQILTDAGRTGQQVAEAILTTDLVTKEAYLETEIGGQTVRLGGMAKGSGMIHPNMGTMLAVVTTDANVSNAALQAALQQATDRSFNRVTIDGDTSTNDTLLILASGQSKAPLIEYVNQPELEPFVSALTELCISLAKAVARDGEGATKLLEITVQGAHSEAKALMAAKAVAHSPLVKTAMFGNDPNWGRILAAVGYSGITVEPDYTSLSIGPYQLVRAGEPTHFDAIAVHHWLENQKEVSIVVDLDHGLSSATVWTCDYSYKYIEINAEYHT